MSSSDRITLIVGAIEPLAIMAVVLFFLVVVPMLALRRGER